jgi:hypothetical protein
MKTFWACAAICTLLATGGCDPGFGGLDDVEDDAQGDEDDDGASEPEDIWSRELVVVDFELSLETVYTALDGTCTTTRWHTAVGNGEHASGSLAVGIPDPDGNDVVGGITLIGDVAFGEDNTPDECWGVDGTEEMPGNGAGGVLSLKAPRSGDPITLALGAPTAGTIEEVVLDTQVFAADAVYGGGAETLRLQKTVVIPNDGDSGRSAEVTVDLVVDIVVEE